MTMLENEKQFFRYDEKMNFGARLAQIPAPNTKPTGKFTREFILGNRSQPKAKP